MAERRPVTNDIQRYRALAAEELSAAEAAVLPMVRQRHLASAENWDRLADRAAFATPGRAASARAEIEQSEAR